MLTTARSLMVTLIYLVSQFGNHRLATKDVQQILYTVGARANALSPSLGAQTKRSQEFDSADINTIACHSHNDYKQQMPLYNALNAGCISIEADIWLESEELLVGHEKDSLDSDKTLKSMYLDPLTSIIVDQNPDLNLNSDNGNPSHEWKGVYSASTTASLILLIDLKTKSSKTLPVLMDQLSPLQKHGLLTHFDGNSVVQGPLTIVGSGNTDIDAILSARDRYVFFDAPLNKLDDDDDEDSYNGNNSIFASVSYRDVSSGGDKSIDEIQEDVQTQVNAAHARGLKARYWRTPALPGGKDVWDMLWDVKADVFNTNNPQAAKDYLNEKKGS
ncbi:MAG: hypothetical protein Q9195_009227 [Heterodermia aff. obscurata]